MRGTKRPGGRNTSGVARHLATTRIVLVLVALMSMLLLSPGCSEESANSAAAADLEEALASGKPTLAGFVGKEGASTSMMPILEGLGTEYDGVCNVVVIDVTEQKDIASQYGIALTPTQVFFDSTGAEVERIVGAFTEKEIVDHLAAIGGGVCNE